MKVASMSIPSYQPSGPFQEQNNPAPPPPHRRRWPWIVGGVVAFMFVVGAVSYAAGPSSSQAVTTRTIVRTVTITIPAPAPVTVVKTVTVTAPPQIKTVTAVPPPPAPGTSIDADGVYAIGQDITAGTWHTTGGSECYYARLKTTDTSEIIDNNNIDGPATVTVRSSDGAFQISGGCTWTKLH
jgi:hypothetical protein